MVSHLAMFDAVAVSGHHEARVVEFVDHLHEHFFIPSILKGAHYQAPLEPGAGAEIKIAAKNVVRFKAGSDLADAVK